MAIRMVVAALSVMVLGVPSPSHLAAQEPPGRAAPDYRIGFTLQPDSVTHQGNEGMRAALVDARTAGRPVVLLSTPYVPVGTQFAGWLRDGRALLVTTHHVSTAAHPDGRALMVDTYVVDPEVGSIKACLTCKLHTDQSENYLYSQTAQPVYTSRRGRDVSYYVISTHTGKELGSTLKSCI